MSDSRSSHRHHGLLLLVGLTLALVVSTFASASGVSVVTIERVDLDAAGNPLPNGLENPAISSDGQFIAFVTSEFTGSVSCRHVWLRNLSTGALRQLDVGSSGQSAQCVGGNDTEYTFPASLSDDGHYVVFASNESGLPGAGNGVMQVYVADTWTGKVTLVSSAPDGASGDAMSYTSAISGDGRYVAFYSTATNLVSVPRSVSAAVYVRDLFTGKLVIASVGPDGVPLHYAAAPSLSGDGSEVAFTGQTTCSPSCQPLQAYVRNLTADTTQAETTQGSYGPALMSEDGNVLSFGVQAANGTCVEHIRQLSSGMETVISARCSGYLSFHGRYYAFIAYSPNGYYDVYRLDLTDGSKILLSVKPDGEPMDGSRLADFRGSGEYALINSTDPAVTGSSPGVGWYRVEVVPADTTPPSISCGAADTFWHTRNVSVSCTASDSGSGLAVPADASFTLSTSVAAGEETDSAMTDSLQVCDNAGNCATAGPIGPFKVDLSPPTITLGQTTVDATSPSGAPASTFGAIATDGVFDPSPPVSCSPDPVPVGDEVLTCTATDQAGNTTTQPFDVHVAGSSEQTSDLLTSVTANNLGSGTSLSSKLQAVLDSLAAGNTSPACSQLGAFINEVQAESGKKLTIDEADSLIAQATQIEKVLAC